MITKWNDWVCLQCLQYFGLYRTVKNMGRVKDTLIKHYDEVQDHCEFRILPWHWVDSYFVATHYELGRAWSCAQLCLRTCQGLVMGVGLCNVRWVTLRHTPKWEKGAQAGLRFTPSPIQAPRLRPALWKTVDLDDLGRGTVYKCHLIQFLHYHYLTET